jgi:hypothetical protein
VRLWEVVRPLGRVIYFGRLSQKFVRFGLTTRWTINLPPVLSTHSFDAPRYAMSKRTVAEAATDSDNESRQAGPSKRARPAGSPGRSNPSAVSPIRINENESSSEEDSDDHSSDDQASLDLNALEEQIRTHIDATRQTNDGRLGVCSLILLYSLAQ